VPRLIAERRRRNRTIGRGGGGRCLSTFDARLRNLLFERCLQRGAANPSPDRRRTK
jgi:hypothetical protein